MNLLKPALPSVHPLPHWSTCYEIDGIEHRDLGLYRRLETWYGPGYPDTGLPQSCLAAGIDDYSPRHGHGDGYSFDCTACYMNFPHTRAFHHASQARHQGGEPHGRNL